MKKRNKTLGNKICALSLIYIGLLSIFIDGDFTALVVVSMLAVPLLIAKKNILY